MKAKFLALFWSSRPASWINTAFPFAAAYLVTSGSFDARLIIGALYFLIPYNLLMYGINDVFDYESDLRNPRKGGIEGAKLGRETHKPIIIAAAALNLPFLATLLLLGNLTANFVLLAVVFFVLAYSLPKLRFKERPLLDSMTSALHFVGPAAYGFALTAFSTEAGIILAAFFVWGMASHAFGAVQDIASDRAVGIGSIATVIGARRTVCLAMILYVLSAILLALLGPAVWPIVPFIFLYAANISPYRTLRDAASHQANNAWRRFIYLNLVTGAAITATLLFHIMRSQ